MKPDPAIDEIHEIRHQISAEHGHDPRRLGEYYRKLQERHKDRIISPGSQPPERGESGKSVEPATTRE